MTITLDQARAQAQQHLDSSSNARWTNTEIDTALKAARQEIINFALQAGLDIFRSTTTVSSGTNSTVSLAGLGVQQIHSVKYIQGNTFIPVKPLTQSQKTQLASMTGTFEVIYTGLPAFPSSGSSNIEMSNNSVSNDIIDELICIKAAKIMAVKENMAVNMLLAVEQSLLDSLKATLPVPSSSAFLRKNSLLCFPLYWTKLSNDSLQIHSSFVYA